jgi:hypothetical protein
MKETVQAAGFTRCAALRQKGKVPLPVCFVHSRIRRSFLKGCDRFHRKLEVCKTKVTIDFRKMQVFAGKITWQKP